jgi:repressor LexA
MVHEEKLVKVMDYIRKFSEENGYTPSVREIGKECGIKSTATVHSYIEKLQNKGYLNKTENKKRAVTIGKGSGITVPLIGTVTAGIPILAFENQEGSISWDGDPSCFALRVRGDSMIGAGIHSGDLVVVRPQQSADDGQIVVARIGDEATVKRLSRKDGQVWLLPENDAFEPIDGSEAELVGLVKALVRYY